MEAGTSTGITTLWPVFRLPKTSSDTGAGATYTPETDSRIKNLIVKQFRNIVQCYVDVSFFLEVVHNNIMNWHCVEAIYIVVITGRISIRASIQLPTQLYIDYCGYKKEH